MTLSLLHFNPQTGASASISATGGVAVGGYVNHSWRNVGGCATQGLFTNPWYPEKAKTLLSQGYSSEQVIEQLKRSDLNHAQRQCMVVDKSGHTAFINGESNIPYTGALTVQGAAVAGNMLESDKVLQVFLKHFLRCICINSDQVLDNAATPVYQADYEQHLPEHLIASLEVALQAGGDKRGTFSASLRVESLTQAPIDIRVDWSKESLIQDLNIVLSRVREHSFKQFLENLPTQ